MGYVLQVARGAAENGGVEHIFGATLEAALHALAMSWGTARRAGKSFRHPSTWEDGDGSLWTWLAAFGLLLPVVPLLVFTLRFGALALRMADDDLMWVLGIVLFLPLAAFAIAAAVMATAWALWIAAALLTGRPGAGWYAGLFVLLMLMIGAAPLTAGLRAYGWWIVGTAFASGVLLAARAGANSARPKQPSYFG